MPVPRKKKDKRQAAIRRAGHLPKRGHKSEDADRNLPSEVYFAPKKEEGWTPSKTTEVTIKLPINLRFYGDLPKDLDAEALGKEVARLLNECEDGNRNHGTTALELILPNFIRRAASNLLWKIFGERYRPRMISTGPGRRTNLLGLMTESRLREGINVHASCGNIKEVEVKSDER